MICWNIKNHSWVKTLALKKKKFLHYTIVSYYYLVVMQGFKGRF